MVGMVLVVEDDALHAELLVSALRDEVPGVRVETASSIASATARIDAHSFDALVLDVGLPDGDGLGLIQRMRRRGEETPFLLLTADGSAHTAVRALRAGAIDYVVKGSSAVERAVGVVADLFAPARIQTDTSPLIGESRAMRAVRAGVRRCGRTDVAVRIEGETGVGKELVARLIHEQSDRRQGPFVAVNCGALPEALAEAELFGHVRGAYTGATGDRAGLVEHAFGGTLMLDEVEDLPPSIQGKLLRLLQEAEYRPVGTARVRRADVRILAASNRDLGELVRAGTFRADLFYRLDVLRVHVPPLRRRRDDIAALIAYMLRRGARAQTRARVSLAELPTREELAEMQSHDWPGNVRELENFVERARAVAELAGWRAGWASALAQLTARAEEEAPVPPAAVAESDRADAERLDLESRLARHRWRREAVARELGVSRVTLWRRMRRLGLIGAA